MSAVAAGKQFGYSNDYIARLARDRKIVGRRIGRQWYVDAHSLQAFIRRSDELKRAHAERLRSERRSERNRAVYTPHVSVVGVPRSRVRALVRAGSVLCVSVAIGTALYAAGPLPAHVPMQRANVIDALKEFARTLYTFGARESSVARDNAQGANEKDVSVSAEGIVIIPPGDRRSAEDVRASFSDDVVIVEDHGGESGIITPLFRAASTTEYRYLMVPLSGSRSNPP